MGAFPIPPAKASQFTVALNGDANYNIKNVIFPKIGGTEVRGEYKVSIEFYNPIVKVVDGQYLQVDFNDVLSFDSISVYISSGTGMSEKIYQRYHFFTCKEVDVENSTLDITNTTGLQTIKVIYSFEDYKIEFVTRD